MNPVRVLLVDDHALVRAGIRSLLQKMPGIEVVAESADGRQALDFMALQRPDVVLMDVAMPRLNGLEATALVTRDFPAVAVIIVSMFANEEYVASALRAGAAGYLLKNADPAELELAIRTVARGETYLTSTVSKKVIEDYKSRLAEKLTPLERLTHRQRETLQLIAEGNTTKEIAQRLNLSVKTVEMHRTALMRHLDTHDIAGLVRYAIRLGLVSMES